MDKNHEENEKGKGVEEEWKVIMCNWRSRKEDGLLFEGRSALGVQRLSVSLSL